MFICFKTEKGEPVVYILGSRPLVILQAAWKIGGIGEVELGSSSAHFLNLRYQIWYEVEI